MRNWKFVATRTALRRAHVSDNDKAAPDMMIRGHGIQTVAVPGFVDWGASLGWSCVRCGGRVLLAFFIPYYNEWVTRIGALHWGVARGQVWNMGYRPPARIVESPHSQMLLVLQCHNSWPLLEFFFEIPTHTGFWVIFHTKTNKQGCRHRSSVVFVLRIELLLNVTWSCILLSQFCPSLITLQGSAPTFVR